MTPTTVISTQLIIYFLYILFNFGLLYFMIMFICIFDCEKFTSPFSFCTTED